MKTGYPVSVLLFFFLAFEGFGDKSSFAPALTYGVVKGGDTYPKSAFIDYENAQIYFISGRNHYDKRDYAAARLDLEKAVRSDPSVPLFHYYLAKTYYSIEALGRAEKCCKNGLKLDPEDIDTLLLLAGVLDKKEEKEEALKVAVKALELSPENPLVFRTVIGLLAASGDKEQARGLMTKLASFDTSNSEIQIILGELEYSAFQNYSAATTRLEAVLADERANSPALLAMMHMAYKENDLAKADAMISRILALDAANISALRIQAEILVKRDQLSAGLEAYGKLVKRYSYDQDLKMRYAELLLQAGKVFEAEKLALELTESDLPINRRSAHWILAKLYDQQGKHRDSLNQMKSSLELTLGDSPARIYIVYQLMKLDEMDEARKEAESLFALNPQDTKIVNLLTKIMVIQGNSDDAIDLLTGLIDESPDNDVFRMRRIEVFMQSPRWKESLVDLRSLHKKIPANIPIKNNLAFILARSGEDLDLAGSLSEENLVALPENPIIMDTRAFVLAAQGQHDEAIKFYEEALVHASENPVIRLNYATSLLATGQGDKAKLQLQRALKINATFSRADEARAILASLKSEDE